MKKIKNKNKTINLMILIKRKNIFNIFKILVIIMLFKEKNLLIQQSHKFLDY